MLRRSLLFGPVLLGLAALAALSQTPDWKTLTQLNGVDFSGLTPAQRTAVLNVLRTEPCACGCSMKVAECRTKDPACGVSRRLAAFALRDASAGKPEAAIRADLDKYAKEPPPLLDPPVKLATAGAPFKGPATAKVTIVEFSDFQCPYCAKAATEAAAVVKKFPTQVKLVFKQFPLEDHSQAALAAEASLSAQAQGKFWELHDKMYANFRSINRARILAWAVEVGMDVDKLRADLDSHKYAARVHAEEQEGEVAGVEGTPTFYINGQKYNGVFELSSVAPVILDELKK